MNINEILNKIDDSNGLILKSYNYALEKTNGLKRKNNDDLIDHLLYVANILVDLNVDDITISAALLHDLPKYAGVDINEIEEKFGKEIASIVKSITQINTLEVTDDSEDSAIYLRKVMVGLCEDVRVLFIKLADRLHNMKTMNCFSLEHQKKVANETLSVLVPIAHRLGINSLKSELENLCLFYLKPDVYKDIEDKLNDKKNELSSHLDDMKETISSLLVEEGISFEIKGRVKSVYSIYNKLSSGKKWDDIYDILALRIFVNKPSECYQVLGIIHAKYRPVPNRFKDYISVPKENMYQSLHTTVFGDDNMYYEIQIRTYEMDEIAEKGIASHWSYKEKSTKRVQSMMEQKLELYRNIIESNDSADDNEFKKIVGSDILSESIYIFTPKGDVMELPNGSTPIDFAYRIHSKVGDTLTGAIVNDLMVPIDTTLKDGDIVKILTNPNSKPNKDWVNMCKTSSAKSKIKAFFSKIDHDEYVSKGKNILEKELRKRKLSFTDTFNDEALEKIERNLNLKDLDDIYLSIGSFRYTANFLINYVTAIDAPEDALIIKKAEKTHVSKKVDILVDGKDDILTHLAKCCNPIKGDEIIGFITKNEGIAIHRKNCLNIGRNQDKFIDVAWNTNTDNQYEANLTINMSTEKDKLSDIIAVITNLSIGIININNAQEGIYKISVKVKDINELDKLILNLKHLRYVKEVIRK